MNLIRRSAFFLTATLGGHLAIQFPLSWSEKYGLAQASMEARNSEDILIEVLSQHQININSMHANGLLIDHTDSCHTHVCSHPNCRKTFECGSSDCPGSRRQHTCYACDAREEAA